MTLVELLVAMVIFGLVMTLVSQAVSQVGQLVRVADEASQALGLYGARGAGVAISVANLVAPTEAADVPFRGRAESIGGFSTQPLQAADLGVGPLELRLRVVRGPSVKTVLEARFRVHKSGVDEWRAVGLFDGRAEFSFRNRAGAWVGQWPPLTSVASATPEVLPAAIMVRDADRQQALMVYSVTASEKAQMPSSTSPFEAAP